MLSHGQGLSSTLHLGFVSAATQPCLLGCFQHVHSCNMSFSFWSSCSAALGSEMRLGTLPPPLQAQAGQTWNSANRLETLTKRWQHKMNWWISDEYVMNIWWICDECRSTCTHSRQVVIMMPVVQSPCSTALCAAAARPGMHTRSYEKQQRGTKIAVACKRLWNKECMILGGYHKRPPKCVSFVQLYANCSFHKRVPCSLSFAAFAWLWFCQEAWSFERFCECTFAGRVMSASRRLQATCVFKINTWKHHRPCPLQLDRYKERCAPRHPSREEVPWSRLCPSHHLFR